MPEPNTGDRNSHGSRADEFRTAKLRRGSPEIIFRRTGNFDPTTYRDRYQEALRALIEAKLKGLPIKPQEVITQPPVIDLMAALKRSLAQELPKIGAMTDKQKRPRRAAAPRQRSLLLPVTGGRKTTEEPATEPAAVAMRPRKRRQGWHKEVARNGSVWLSVVRARLGRIKHDQLALAWVNPGAAYFFRRRCSSCHSTEPG